MTKLVLILWSVKAVSVTTGTTEIHQSKSSLYSGKRVGQAN